MQNFNRLFSLMLLLALMLGACAPGSVSPQEQLEPASLPTEPAPDPAKPEPATPEAETPLPEKIATFESSVPITTWDNNRRQHKLQLVDPASGLPVPGYEPILLGANYFHIFSPDQKKLAIVTFKSDMSPTRPTLHILDLTTWQEDTFGLTESGWVSSLAFSADGNMLAIAQNYSDSKLTIFDLKSESILTQTPIEFMASRMKFSADGQNLMLYGPVLINRFTENEQSDGPPVVAILNSQDLSIDWSIRVEGVRDGVYPTGEKQQPTHEPGAAMYYYPGVVFSPVEDSLYIVHPDEDELTTVDFDSRSIKTVEILPKLSWIERLLMLTASVAYAKVGDGTGRSVAISSDGQRLYSIGTQSRMKPLSNGEFEYEQSSLNFQVIATSDGSELTNLESDASDLSISPDDKMVLVRSWGELVPWTDLFDTKSGKFVAHVDAAYMMVARRMDGSYLLVSVTPTGENQSKLSAYSYENGDLLGAWKIPDFGNWLTVP